MSEKILYYLGAGASAKVLPLARSVYDEKLQDPIIKGLAYELANLKLYRFTDDLNNAVLKKSMDIVIENCSELAKKANEFGDVDTYAKYLHITNNGGQEIQKLKQTLSQYFSIKQAIFNASDSRYLTWMVSIMNKQRFPENVKILSWNYDYQVQLAALHFGKGEEIKYTLGGFSHSSSILKYYPNLDPTFDENQILDLIHLNGIAGFGNIKGQKTNSIFQSDYFGDKQKALSFLNEHSLDSLLHFAWDGSNYQSKLMNRIQAMIDNTTIMVVIGYSFPFFNRETDKEIFGFLKTKPSFKKIYYQDPILNGKQLRDQFDLDNQIKIKHISNTDNFHIPFEY